MIPSRLPWAVARIDATEQPIPDYGSPEWAALPDNSRAKWAAALIAAECWRTYTDPTEVAFRLRTEVDALRAEHEAAETAEYVIDANSSRRHMSTGARAMATAMVLVEDGRRDGGKWSYGAVAMSRRSESGSSGAQWKQRLAEAGVILDHAPDLATAVVSGDLALDAAHRAADELDAAEARWTPEVVAAVHRTANRPSYARLCDLRGEPERATRAREHEQRMGQVIGL